MLFSVLSAVSAVSVFLRRHAQRAEFRVVRVHMHLPEVVERRGDVVALHPVVRGAAHALAAFVVFEQFDDRLGPAVLLLVGDHEPGEGVVDHLLGAALVGDNNREARRLRFHDDLAERVGDAREDEEVGRRVQAREFLAVAEAEEVCAAGGARLLACEALLHPLAVRPVADEHEFGVDVLLNEFRLHLRPHALEHGEVLLDAHPAAVDDLARFLAEPEGFPDRGVAEIAVERVGVHAREEGLDLVAREAEFVERGHVVARAGEDRLVGRVEALHELLGDPGVGLVLEEPVDVRGEVGVVDADDGAPEDRGAEQAERADGPGRRDIDDIRLEFLDVAQDREQRGEREVEVLVARHRP